MDTIQQPPPLFSSPGRFLVAGLAWLKWTAALRGQPSPPEGSFVPHCGYCLLRGATRDPCGAVPTLHILSWRVNWESRWSERCETPSWLYGPSVGDGPTGPALRVSSQKRTEKRLLTSESPSTLKCCEYFHAFNPNTSHHLDFT